MIVLIVIMNVQRIVGPPWTCLTFLNPIVELIKPNENFI